MKRGLRQASPERGVLRRWEWRKAAQSSLLKSRNPTRKRFGSSHASLKGGPQRGRRGLKTQTSAASMYGGQWSSIEPETVNRTAPKPLWGICLSFSTTENLEALIYGRQIRVASAAASGCRPRRPEAKRVQAQPASPERGGACEAGGGVRKRRIRELQSMLPEFVDRTDPKPLRGTARAS